MGRVRKAFATDRAEGRLSAKEGTRLARFASVWAVALDMWDSGDAARRSIFAAHPLLHGRKPVVVVLENEFGRPVVVAPVP